MKRRLDLGVMVRSGTVLTILLFGSVNFFWIRRETAETLDADLEMRARHHAESIAVQSYVAGLLDDKSLLNKMVNETRSLDPVPEPGRSSSRRARWTP